MILGLSIATFTLVHVLISLAGLLAGLVVLGAMIAGRRASGWTALFLATTVATSATGFLFPFRAIGPAHVVGLISLVVLAVALLALYGARLAGLWRPAYVVAAVLALYLNAFVAVAQAFQKLPALQALAPTQSEPPFLEAQIAVLALFVILGALALWRFRPQMAPA
ncbi:hypothetical protein [Labrys wisconsinensis]|uniref:Uncharacterized protein n=1 Tax=Labrys wisconsinensis TaxID=425677 RepID=A0ABU0JKP4_9HYPH|nr:hypothetical protein [Labrys wisconsinensis]MDQ0473834.1 hypothetical protein [Labrys wisconsinensis]